MCFAHDTMVTLKEKYFNKLISCIRQYCISIISFTDIVIGLLEPFFLKKWIIVYKYSTFASSYSLIFFYETRSVLRVLEPGL